MYIVMIKEKKECKQNTTNIFTYEFLEIPNCKRVQVDCLAGGFERLNVPEKTEKIIHY